MGVALAAAMAAGVLLAVQGAVNGALGAHCGRLGAAVVSFGGGTLVMAVAVVALGDFGTLVRGAAVPFWQLLGGIYGAVVVTAIICATPVLGAALTFAVMMFGQLIGGMAIDGFGLFAMEPLALGPLRLGGCLLMALGIVAVYRGRRGAAEKRWRGRGAQEGLMVAAAFIAGLCSAVQAPTNAALGAVMGPVDASFVNMAVGFVAVTLLYLVRSRGRVGALGKGSGLWMHLGGLYGAAYVLLMVVATPPLGAGVAMGALMGGQLAGGVVLDGFGLLGCAKVPITCARAVGIALIALGVILAAASRAMG